jgi:hypothetical protein
MVLIAIIEIKKRRGRLSESAAAFLHQAQFLLCGAASFQ